AFTGILDAPEAVLRADDCGLTLVGAADLGTFSCTSAATAHALAPDPRVAALESTAWRLASVHDAPVGDAGP
ncbi:hypothetical protein, partial [Staphylococcus aureus]